MLHLTDTDLSLLAGERGPGSRMAMRIIVRMAEVFDAGELLDITAAHIDSTIFMGDATLEYAERLADLGATVAVPATSNVSGVDEHGWAEWPVPPDWAEKARRQMDAYRRMGVSASFTCAPYQTELRPAFGQQIAWGESNAIAFANTVLGARTERYPDLLDICAAITGRVPAVGLHLTANRAGQLLIRLVDVPPSLQADDSFYPVLGHLVGKLAGDRIPVIDGLDGEANRGSAQGALRGRGDVGRGGAVPHRRRDARGADPRRGVPRPRAGRDARHRHVRAARRPCRAHHGNRRDARSGAPRQPALLAGGIPPARAAARWAGATPERTFPGHHQPGRRGVGGTRRAA